MRAGIVAKKDFKDAIRSWELWALTFIFTVFTAGLFWALNASNFLSLAWPAYLQFIGGSNFGITTREFIIFYTGLAEPFVPVVALTVTHKAIAGEVESGSIKFLISAPITRFDAILGKIMGRSAVLWTALGIGFVLSVVVIISLGGQFNPVPYLLFILLTCLFALAYASIGVGLSAVAGSGERAVQYTIGFFIAVALMLDYVPNVVYYFTTGSFFPQSVDIPGPTQGPPDAPGWFFFIARLSPGRAFNEATLTLVAGEPLEYLAAFPEGLPVYLSGPAALVLLLLWIIVPTGLAYLKFRNADLN